MLAIIFWSSIRKDCIEVQETKERESRGLAFTSFTKRAVTAKKCTKKRDARAKLLFANLNQLFFLPFLLTSPSSLLKLTYQAVA